MNSFKTRQLVIDAMLAAICAVLGYLAFSSNNLKVSFEGFPVIIAALLFGPVSGGLVGFVGIFIYQVVRYGLMLSTPMWVLPYVVSGVFLGVVAKKKDFNLSKKDYWIYIIANELLVSVINSIGVFIDGHAFGYYTPQSYAISTLIRFAIALLKAVLYVQILPPIINTLKKLKQR